jgi:hypothetical protein
MPTAPADAFGKFYAAYPRKKVRKDAEKAWKQVDGDRHADAIMAALEWQVAEMLTREPEHRPYPATWLRGERWTDERDTPVQTPKSAFEIERDAKHARSQAQQVAYWQQKQRGQAS